MRYNRIRRFVFVLILISISNYAVICLSRDEVRMSDSYGKMSWDKLKERLSAHAVALNDADSRDVIFYFYYGDAKICLSEARKQVMKSKKHLMAKYAISAERIVLVEGGYRERSTTEVFIQPPTLKIAPTPTIEQGQLQKKCR